MPPADGNVQADVSHDEAVQPAGLSTFREIERKIRVPDDFLVPPLAGAVSGVVHAVKGAELLLEAAYHDTEDVRLVRWGATLRRRTGGSDAGWHLKLPVEGAGPGVRDEIGLPLAAGEVGQVPEEIADVVRALVREAPIRHIASVRTRRTPYALLDGDRRQVAELADDRVEVLEGDEVVRAYHEIEVEARGPDAEDLLEAVVTLLVDAGGASSTEGKGAAALGVRAGGAPDVVVPPWPGLTDPAGEVVRCIIAQNVRKFLLEDVRVRRDLPDSVHQMRVAARTLRSALRTFRTLVDREWADLLRDELHWAADAVGAVRDAEVHLRRLREHARALPPEEAARVVPALDRWLKERLAQAREAALGELSSERHLRLLVDLVEAARAPRLTSKARDEAKDVLPGLVEKSAKKLTKAAGALSLESPPEDWHKTRIRAKRARYAAEAVAPVLGSAAEKWGTAIEEVTDLLGDHQDSVVAQELLTELAAHTEIDGPTGYALGLLNGVEAEHERAYREQFESVWDKTSSTLKRNSLD